MVGFGRDHGDLMVGKLAHMSCSSNAGDPVANDYNMFHYGELVERSVVLKVSNITQISNLEWL